MNIGKCVMVEFLSLKNNARHGSRSEMDNVGVVVAEEFPIEYSLVKRLRPKQIDNRELDAKYMAMNPLGRQKSQRGVIYSRRPVCNGGELTSLLGLGDSDSIELEGSAKFWAGLVEDMLAELNWAIGFVGGSIVKNEEE